MQDMFKTINVAFVCWLYMALYMKSIFLSTVGIITVLMSVPISLVIYSRLFAITYFSSIHIAIVIIIIGIGSDDIFVFHDAWCHAKEIQRDTVKVMAHTIRSSASALFMTSSTSTMAFVACSLSSIMPIRAFGLFASIVVPTVYILTLVVMPFAYFIHTKSILPLQDFVLSKIWSKKSVATQTGEAQETEGNKISEILFQIKKGVLLLALLSGSLCIYYTTRLETSTSDDKILRPSTPIQKALDWWTDEIWHDSSIHVNFIWGLKPDLDMSMAQGTKWQNFLQRGGKYQL